MRKTAANVEMQGIEFQIVNDSAEASRGLDELGESLKRLKSNIGGAGTSLSKAADGIRQIKNAIKDTKLSSFESGMRRISDSLKPLGEMKFTSVTSFLKQLNNVSAENLEKIAAIDFSNLKEAATDAKAISGVSRVSNAAESVKSELPPVTDMGTVEIPVQTATVSQEFEETRRKAEEATSAVRKTTSAIKENSKAMKEGANATKAHNSKLLDFVKSLKRIAMYRAVRSVISGITSSVKEGIQNLAQYSAAINSTDTWQANKTMSEYASTLQQVKNTIGSAVMPVLNSLLPLINSIADAFMNAVNAINQFFSALSGKSTFTKATKNAVDYAGSLSGATSAAKELKRTVMGFDELNLLTDNSSSGSGSGGSGGTNYGDMFEEVEIDPKFQWLKDNLDTIKETAIAIGGAFATWEIGTALVDALGKIKDFFTTVEGLGSLALIIDVKDLFGYLKDIQDNGADLSNVSGAIAEISGIIGDIAIMSGDTDIGFFLKAVQGVGEIVSAVSDMIANKTVDWDNAMTALKGVSNIIPWIGVITEKAELIGVGFAFQGIVGVIDGVKQIIDACKTGDWSKVEWVDMAISGIMAIAGIFVAIKNVKEKIGSSSEAKTALDTVTQSTETLSTGTSTMTTKMTDLVKNIGLGVAILAEVAAGAIIFAGAIAVLGMELDKVGQAWQPVIDNAATVAIAVGVGTVLLVAIGAVCYGLGTLGGTAALNIGIGAAILVELGVATGLFIVEIWAIGKGLDEIGQAWQPVLDNSETIITAIEVGTGLLVGIGVVTAALGAATVASYGLLPAAILIGVGVLEELGVAFDALVKNLTKVSKQLRTKLATELSTLNKKMPKLTEDVESFVDFMATFATAISDYTKSMGSITWSTIVAKFTSLFAGDPIKSFSTSVSDINLDAQELNEKLEGANEELEETVTLLVDYKALLTQVKELTSGGNTLEMGAINANFKQAGANIVLGLSEGMSQNASSLNQQIESINKAYSSLQDDLKESSTNCANVVQSTFEAMSSIIKMYVTTISESFKSISGAMSSVSLGTLNTSSITTDLNVALAKMNTFKEKWDSAWQSFSKGGFRSSWNNIMYIIESGLNSTINAVNKLVTALNRIAYASLRGGTASTVTKISLPRYAAGGFPTTGELFIAREAGAEMVGSIGGRTAVANNDQIETALENAAYRGMRAAMSEGGSSGGGQTRVIVATVDGRVLYETVVDEARSDTLRTGYNRLVEV